MDLARAVFWGAPVVAMLDAYDFIQLSEPMGWVLFGSWIGVAILTIRVSKAKVERDKLESELLGECNQ